MVSLLQNLRLQEQTSPLHVHVLVQYKWNLEIIIIFRKISDSFD